MPPSSRHHLFSCIHSQTDMSHVVLEDELASRQYFVAPHGLKVDVVARSGRAVPSRPSAGDGRAAHAVTTPARQTCHVWCWGKARVSAVYAMPVQVRHHDDGRWMGIVSPDCADCSGYDCPSSENDREFAPPGYCLSRQSYDCVVRLLWLGIAARLRPCGSTLPS